MARPRDAGRLIQIADAALTAFGRNGFRLTQMADIARDCGLSAGTLYLSVESKEALLHLAVRHALGLVEEGEEGPVTEGLAASVALLRREIGRQPRWPCLKAALARAAAGDMRAELDQVMGEIYDLLNQQRRLIWLVDRCGRDLPDLGIFLTTIMRGGMIGDLETYAQRRIGAGALSPLAGRPGAMRAVLELISWMAMHRTRDPSPPAIDEPAARRLTLDLVAASLLAPAGPIVPD